MKNYFFLAAAVFSLSLFPSRAQVPPPEKLLPNDTLFFVTAPDFSKFCDVLGNSTHGQLWNDPSMKAFKDKFVEKFKKDFVAPLEREFGIEFSDYKGLAQGQFTFAVTRNGWQQKEDASPGWIFLIDTKEKSATVTTNLATLKTKWVESGKQIKTEKIRDIEFNTLITSTDSIGAIFEKIFPSTEPKDSEKSRKNLEILIGQSGSLLLIGNSVGIIERTLVQQAGGIAPQLSNEAVYEAHHNAMFRDAPFYAWLHVKPLIEIFTRRTENSPSEEPSNPLMPKMENVIASSGIGGLQTAAFSYRNGSEGAAMQFSLGIPEANRQGLFKVLVAENKEAAPPFFVPADVTKFFRWRLNMPKAWTGLEAMLTEMSPAVGGAFQLIFESAGKDKDPEYDLKKELLGNLGDDLINYKRKPANATMAELDSPPSIYLVGSPAAERLADAFKVGMSLLAPSPIKDREFLGRKIYTMPPSSLLASASDGGGRGLNFSGSGGYLALSSSVPMLEEYLRSSETKAKALSEIAGFNEAAEKVGGTGMGLFAYNNQKEIMRGKLAAMKNEEVTLSDLMKNPAAKPRTPEQEEKIDEWADFSLLPPFESISKYFHYSVYAGNFNANGFTVKFFYPTPPELKK